MQTKTKSQTKTEDAKVEGIAPTLTFDIDVQHVEIERVLRMMQMEKL